MEQLIKPFIRHFNYLVEIPNCLIEEIKEFTIANEKDGNAYRGYEKKNHNNKKTLNRNWFEGKTAEWGTYLFLKYEKNRDVKEPDMTIWTPGERMVNGKDDPDLVDPEFNYHCKSTGQLTERGYSWSFRNTDSVKNDPKPNELIIGSIVNNDTNVVVKFMAKATALKNYYEEPVLDKYKPHKKCLYWDTFEKNNLIIPDERK